MSELVIAMLLTYQTKCGIHYQTDIHTGFTSELDCRKYGERMEAMYLRSNKTNVLAFEYTCYKKN